MAAGPRISPGSRAGGGQRNAIPRGRFRVERVDEVDSTNRLARDRVRAGEEPGLVVVAGHQTQGRGRLDRRWESPPGSSLLVSVVLPGGIGDRASVGATHMAVVAVAVALAEAIRDVAGVDPELKWPNDLVVGDRKLAGILAETEGDAVVVGAGCNVNWDTFPPDLAGTATACNLEAGHPVDRDALLDAFLDRLAAHLDAPAACDEAYRARLTTIGRRVRVQLTADDLVGDAVGLDETGALVVHDTTGVDHVVVSGDVVHLRDA